MNWYSFTKYIESAQQDNSAEAFLARLGVPEETISYVTTMQPQMKQKAVGYLQRNPQTDSNTLMQMFQTPNILNPTTPQQNPKPTDNPQEVKFVQKYSTVPEFSEWVSIQLKKMKNAHNLQPKDKNTPPAKPGYLYHTKGRSYQLNSLIDMFDQIFDWYNSVLRARQLVAQGANELQLQRTGIPNPNIQLAGLSLDQAGNLSETWHDFMAGRGDGTEYMNEQEEDIVYGPQWKNPKFQGWTIKRVYGQNNLDAEGNKVGHCVGDYCDNVDAGKTRIFSLRDPKNVPYVTMEVDSKSWQFRQIQGNGPKTGNREPSDGIKAAIGEWMKTLPGVSLPNAEGYDYDDLGYSSLDEDLYTAVYKGNEGYGIQTTIVDWDYNEAHKEVLEKLDDRGGNYNNGGSMTKYVAKALANIAVDSDRQKINQGLVNLNNMKGRAINEIWHTKKYPFYAETPFDKLNKHALQQVEPLLIEKYQAAEERIQKWIAGEHQKPFKNQQDKLNRIRAEAYSLLQSEQEIDISYSENSNKEPEEIFRMLPVKYQKKYMTQVLDKMFAIGEAYERRQHGEEHFYDNYDDSYLEYPDEPNEDDFATPEEYQAALDEHENEKERIREEDADAYREETLPYCLDDKVIDFIENNLAENPMKIPDWIPEFFQTKAPTQQLGLFEQDQPQGQDVDGDNGSYYQPQILWALERAERKRQEAAQAQPIERTKELDFNNYSNASGWYGRVKESQGSPWASQYLNIGHQWTDADYDLDNQEMAKLPPDHKNDALWIWRNNQLEVITADEWHQRGNRGYYFAHGYVFNDSGYNVKGRYDAAKNVVSLFKRHDMERFGNSLYRSLERKFPGARIIEVEVPHFPARADCWYGRVKEAQWNSYLSHGHSWTALDDNPDNERSAKLPPPNGQDALWAWKNNDVAIVTAKEWHQKGGRGFSFVHDEVFGPEYGGRQTAIKGRYDANRNLVSISKSPAVDQVGNKLYRALQKKFPKANIMEF